MSVEWFYQQVIESAAQPPEARHNLLCRLHGDLLDRYIDALDTISEEQAATAVNVGTDQRTLAQVVGHIAEWDRFAILSAGDMLTGMAHPRMITNIDGYVDQNGTSLSFGSIDEFNGWQAEKHAGWSWAQIHALAVDTAQILHTLFTDEWLLNAGRLEQTLPWRKRLRNGVMLDKITMGWCLWLIELEHIGAEHAAELGLYAE